MNVTWRHKPNKVCFWSWRYVTTTETRILKTGLNEADKRVPPGELQADEQATWLPGGVREGTLGGGHSLPLHHCWCSHVLTQLSQTQAGQDQATAFGC